MPSGNNWDLKMLQNSASRKLLWIGFFYNAGKYGYPKLIPRSLTEPSSSLSKVDKQNTICWVLSGFILREFAVNQSVEASNKNLLGYQIVVVTVIFD